MGDNYDDFLRDKRIRQTFQGFDPLWLPDFLKDFQRHLVDWNIRMGRSCTFADCGLGKSIMSLVWAGNVLRKTNRPVLITAPLAVSRQFVSEGEKFGIEVHRTQDGRLKKGINVTNYERLHHFDPAKLSGLVTDEASILKNIDGKTRKQVTDFCTKVKYVLAATATPSPNDHMELGSQSEALGVMSRSQMLGMFFTNNGESTQQWVLKGHARTRFWEWVASWARAVRKPSDLGYDDRDFILPGLETITHLTKGMPSDGFLPYEAVTLNEQRTERRRTLKERCEMVASLVKKGEPFIAWCHLNPEGDLLEEMIPGAVQVAGSDKDEVKEERLWAFTQGQIKHLVTKPTIAGFGLNWQHCAEMSFFPSHSHEQFYQALRRCYRFGQLRKVRCHMVASESESRVLDSMLRKEKQSRDLYDGIIRSVNKVLQSKRTENVHIFMRLPKWIQR